MNQLSATKIYVLIFLLALARSEAGLRSGSQYINRGGACDNEDMFDRINFNSEFSSEQLIQEACNEDPFCHGYVILGETFYPLDSIGATSNFLNRCRDTAFILVKEKREETPHTAATLPNARNGRTKMCFDQNRYSSVNSCRLSAHECELSSADFHQDCCVCGGGRIAEDDVEDPSFVALPLQGTPFYDSKTTTSLILKNGEFNGAIPTEIYSLTKLTTLDLSGNNFSGTIPSGIEKLTDLKELVITGNLLEGPLPEGLASLKKLTVVNIELPSRNVFRKG